VSFFDLCRVNKIKEVEMKKKVMLILFSLFLIVAIMATPVFAKDNQNSGTPFEELWDAIANLQNQIDNIVIGPSQEEFDALAARVTALEARINEPPFFTSYPRLWGHEDRLYESGITASDPDAGDVLVITAVLLPSWLELIDNGDGTATLTGTPSSHGDYSLELRVIDPYGAYDKYGCIIRVYHEQPN